MLQIGKIKIRDIEELQAEGAFLPNNILTPPRKRKNLKPATTGKKLRGQKLDNETVIDVANAITTTHKRVIRKSLLKSALKETPINQRRIDSYFTSCPKNYDIQFPKEPSIAFGKSRPQTTATKSKGTRNMGANKRSTKSPRRTNGRRKRLFTDSTEPSAETMSGLSSIQEFKKESAIECIIIDSDIEDENNIKKEIASPIDEIAKVNNVSIPGAISKRKLNSTSDNCKTSVENSAPTTTSSLSFGQRISKTSCEKTKSDLKSSGSSSISRRKTKPCPPYKIIENTTFAVDAFQFGNIEYVTHYFLTHFHADHYIGLTKSFAMPLYVSPITARLLRTFIKVQEQYIHELELNQAYVINGIEVTALDANHCPGSILLVFKFPHTGKCILHTGDFRACPEMESEPIFWNNDIHTIYLDTTYISDKYAFCNQYESIMRAQDLIEKFLDKHAGKRILYICGAYIIGKEKFWSSLAENYEMKVWAEGNRYKALKAINDERLNRLLVEHPNEANMHVIPMGKLSYLELVEYFKLYEQQYDIIFAIRPSGWEKDTKPRYGSKINLVGIEYSEHSSYEEMQRFVKFLKPEQVISTVPSGKDLMKTSKVPLSWYKYDKLKASSNYQPSIDSFLGKTPKNKTSVRLSNVSRSGLDHFVSPLSHTNLAPNEINNNWEQDESISSKTTEPYERAEQLNRIFKKEARTQNLPTNLHNHENKARRKTTSIANSSEDFEKSELVIPTRNQRNKKKSQRNINSLRQTKTRRIKTRLNQMNTNINTIATNSEECFETSDIQVKTKNSLPLKSKKATCDANKTSNDMPSNINCLHNSLEDEINNFQTKIQMTVNETYKRKSCEMPTTQKRVIISKSVLVKSSNVLSDSQNKPEQKSKTSALERRHKSINLKSQRKCSGFQRNAIYNSTLNTASTLTDESYSSDKTIKQQDLDIPNTEKRTTRSKSALTEATSKSLGSQNKAEKEFDSTLVPLTDKNNKAINSNFSFRTTLITTQENPLLKSTTESTVDLTSDDEKHMQFLKTEQIKMPSPTSSQNWLEELDYKKKSISSKIHVLSQCLTPFKKTKPSIDTQTILNTILEQREDIDHFNCSQLAGLVVETVNKQNPDKSKDHIPVDLLSDADDDWM